MNKLSFFLLLVFIWIFAGGQDIFSQVRDEMTYQEQALNMRENIKLFTDRNMYAVSERIHFRSFYNSTGDTGEGLLSKVLYIELLTPSGVTIANGKFFHGVDGSSGYLSIPGDALTGNYFLRAYTRWMRNFNTAYYSYVPLTIINPDSQDVLEPGGNTSEAGMDLVTEGVMGLICETNKSVYSQGEMVHLTISYSNISNSYPGEYCLTVVPAGLADTPGMLSGHNDPEKDMEFNFVFLPDLRGVSLSGSIILSDDRSPSPFTRIHFSLPGKQAEYFATMSDEFGRFVVTLPDRTGIQELFVVYESEDNLKREIRIDQDYSTELVPFRTASFSLSQEQRNVASRMVLNMQLSKAFGINESKSLVEPDTDSVYPFYGIAPISTYLDDYVKLPTMAEVIDNLVPGVRTKYKKGIPSIAMVSDYSTISRAPPLVLIDHIPVIDQQAIFDIDPIKIERIDVIDDVYIRGDIMYGGVIIFTSRNRDMASVNLDEGSYFFDYQAFHESSFIEKAGSEFPAPEQGQGTKPDRIPDVRNVVFWSDRVIIDGEEKKILYLPAVPGTGEYQILIRGISSMGELVYGKGSFKVE